MNCCQRTIRRLRNAAILIASSVAMCCAAHADDIFNWQPVKIGAGGFVSGFVTHPLNANVRYCRTDVGNAYRWNSTAQQWDPMVVNNQSSPTGMPASASPAPAQSGVESIAVDPENTSIVYMSFKSGFSADVASQNTTVQGSVFKSVDGGQTFTSSNLSVDMNPNSNWRGEGERMAVDPHDGSVIYYGTNDNGLWRSTNGGVNWSQVTASGAPGTSKVIIGMRFDPTSGTVSNFGQTVAKVVYALTLDGGVYKSGDGGSTWSDIASGTGLEGACAFSTISPDGSLWVVQDGTDVLWRYANGSWSNTTVNFAWGQAVNAMSIDPHDTSRVWVIGQGGALSRTDNLGSSWNPCYYQLVFGNTLGWLPQNIAGWRSNGGIFYDASGVLWVPEGNEGVLTYTPTNTETDTASGAPHWMIQSEGIEEFVTHDVIMPPGGNPIVAVEDATGFVIHDPTQFTATQIPLQNQLISDGTGVAYCPNTSSYVAAVGADVNYTGSGATYSGYSSNGGTTWNAFGSTPLNSSGSPVNQAGSIAISARNGWGLGGDHLVWVPTNSQPEYWSHDGGNTWHQGSGFPTTSAYWQFSLKQRDLKADPFVADRFYYVASWSGGCYLSTDGGQTWNLESGSTLPIYTHNGQLEVNRAVQNDLWFVDGWQGASAHGLWHSTDGGATFVNNGSFDYAITLAVGTGSGVLGDQPYSVYVYGRLAGNPTWGIFRSNNGGSSWVRVAYYPAGVFDEPTCMSASWDTYGKVYVGFNGNSFVYGLETGSGGGSGGTDTAVYNFESGVQGWLSASSNDSVATSTTEAYAGSHSLGVAISTSGADTASVRVVNSGSSTPMPTDGQTVTLHVWVPSGSPVTSALAFCQDANWTWTSNGSKNLTAGQWNTLTLTVPSGAVLPLNAIGVNYTVNSAWSGTCYLDSVNFATSGSGSLSGTVTASTTATTENLTVDGITDWAHWGYNGVGIDHKSNGSSGAVGAISGLTAIGGAGPSNYRDNIGGFTRTYGTPDSSVTDTTTGVAIGATGTGFSFTLPASTTPTSAKIWVGGWDSDATFRAHLSDSSAADYVDSSLGYNLPGNRDGQHYNAVYSLTYSSASPGQKLTITWMQTAGNGNVTVQAVTDPPVTPKRTQKASANKPQLVITP